MPESNAGTRSWGSSLPAIGAMQLTRNGLPSGTRVMSYGVRPMSSMLRRSHTRRTSPTAMRSAEHTLSTRAKSRCVRSKRASGSSSKLRSRRWGMTRKLLLYHATVVGVVVLVRARGKTRARDRETPPETAFIFQRNAAGFLPANPQQRATGGMRARGGTATPPRPHRRLIPPAR